MNVAIQGLDTSFHSIAARRIFVDSIELVFCNTFKDVFATLSDKNVDYAVVAIENSLYGSINEVYDLLLKYDFSISGETYQEIGLHLLGLPGSKLEDITDVYSQVMALSESEVFLNSNLSKAERHEHADTALAAQEVKQWNDKSKAAIASLAAGEKYGLQVLASNVETHHQNYTRFIALSSQQPQNESADKTSLTFKTADAPGALHKVLGVFANAGANLTKLESRPIVGSAWQYMYYVDFTVESENSGIGNILKELAEYATDVRVLGSYKSGQLLQA